MNACFYCSDKNAGLREEVVTLKQTLPIKDDLGSCWKNLGIALGLEEAKLYNIGENYRHNPEKAFAVLQMWMDKEGNDATIGLLADTLQKIEKKRIGDKLLGI